MKCRGKSGPAKAGLAGPIPTSLLLKSPIGFKRSYSTPHTHLECNLKIPPTQSHLSSVVRGWDLLLLGRVCVWRGEVGQRDSTGAVLM